MIYDLIIIGGGPAGVSAGIYAARKKMKTVLIADKLADAVRKLKVGDGTEQGVTTGPLINKAAIAKVQEHIDDAVKKGGKIVVGGKSLGGNFFGSNISGLFAAGGVTLTATDASGMWDGKMTCEDWTSTEIGRAHV